MFVSHYDRWQATENNSIRGFYQKPLKKKTFKGLREKGNNKKTDKWKNVNEKKRKIGKIRKRNKMASADTVYMHILT